MADPIPTWDDTIQQYFSNMAEVGCMRAVVTANPRLDLASYDSVKNYINASEEKKNKMLAYLRTGHMPLGGTQWSPEKFAKFQAWVDHGCPKS